MAITDVIQTKKFIITFYQYDLIKPATTLSTPTIKF